MEVVRGLNFNHRGLPIAATVGSYDGVHFGHRVLLESTIREAERIGGRSMVITFDPHPRVVVDPTAEIKLLTTTEEKISLIAEMGVDLLVIIPFDREFSHTSPHDFIRILVEKLGVSSLVVGYDHQFGHAKSGDFKSLNSFSEEFGLNIIRIMEQEFDSRHVSSTVIRRLILKGDIQLSNEMLGHRYIINGEITPDNEFIPASRNKLLPGIGLYRVGVGDREYTLEITHQDPYSFVGEDTPRVGLTTIEFIEQLQK